VVSITCQLVYSGELLTRGSSEPTSRISEIEVSDEFGQFGGPLITQYIDYNPRTSTCQLFWESFLKLSQKYRVARLDLFMIRGQP